MREEIRHHPKGGEILNTHTTKRKAREFDNVHKFDSFCKKVINNEVNRYYNEIKKLEKREKVFSELSLQELRQLYTTDDYFVTEQIFNVLGQDIIVNDERIIEALLTLAEYKRDIILLAYFLDMTDREIGEMLNMLRSTVQYQRNITLQKIKEILEKRVSDV